MKYLSDYIQDAQTECFEKNGVFFAFSDKQFEESKQDGVKYSSLGMGMICPTDNCKTVINELDEIVKQGIKRDIAENGIEAIIMRELDNHEYCITYDVYDTVQSLQGYGITKEMIEKVARSEEYQQRIAEYV